MAATTKRFAIPTVDKRGFRQERLHACQWVDRRGNILSARIFREQKLTGRSIDGLEVARLPAVNTASRVRLRTGRGGASRSKCVAAATDKNVIVCGTVAREAFHIGERLAKSVRCPASLAVIRAIPRFKYLPPGLCA